MLLMHHIAYLIEINLRQFRFVVTFIRVGAVMTEFRDV
jgi:hypothetical protein